MKITNSLNYKILFTNILIFVNILFIPIYFIRIPILSTTLSLLSCFLILSSFCLFILHHKNIYSIFKKEKVLWYFSLLFILSFIPILFTYPTIHGLGVFIEWILFPALFGFLLYIHISKNSSVFFWINYALLTILFLVSTISIIYLFQNILTFDNRLQSFFLSPNHLAMFTTPLIFIVSTQLFISKKFSIKIFTIITILFALITLYSTESFSSILALLLSMLFIIFIYIKKKWILVFFLILTSILLFVISYQKIIHSNTEWHRNSLSSRIMIWDSATFYIQNNILFTNTSIDNFQQIYLEVQPYFTPYLEWSAPTPHNLLLTLWVSGGFFSVLFFCLICARWLFISLTTYYKTKNAAILLFVAALLTILINSIFDTPVWKNDLSVIFWLIIVLQNYFKLNKI